MGDGGREESEIRREGAVGTQAQAEQWLERPAIGLDQRRPIDLLTAPAGVEMVEDYLGRLIHNVYT